MHFSFFPSVPTSEFSGARQRASRLTSLLFVTATAAFAQQAPSASSGHATHEEPVSLEHYLVSASPFERSQAELLQATTVLTGRALALKQQPTLGETLAAEAGMSATYFGPGASRPIIRGLGGDRIRLLENGTGTIDASVTSPDHAVSVEPFLVERIEVVRGPASLLYGNSAVGGVVNVLTHRIETELPEERVSGAFDIRSGSAARELTRGGIVNAALVHTPDFAVILHLDGFRRSSRDVKIPSFAESARIRAEEDAEALEHGEAAPVHARRRLPNSAVRSEGGAVGLSVVSSAFHVGASYSGFDTNYGVPGHTHAHGHEGGEEEEGDEHSAGAGTRIDLRQRRTDVQAEVRHEFGLINRLRFKVGHANYRHRELEADGTVASTFTNRGYDARFEALHGGEDGLNGAVGLQVGRSNFGVTGEEAFLPPSVTRNAALFVFEELPAGPLTWQFGGRIERQEIALSNGQPGRDDTTFSASGGAVWKLDDAHTVAFSATHTGRAPNAQELFANGPHLGTRSFEIGDAALGTEKSLGLELSVRRRVGFVTGEATVFTNRFNGYVFESPTGFVAIEHDGEWEFLSPDDEEAEEHGGGLPVYRYVQRDARFWGVELETLWHLHEGPRHQLDLRLAGDMTRAREGRRHLPRTPATRAMVGLAWTSGAWSLGADAQFVFDQTRVAPNETRSDGYTLASAHATYRLTAGRMTYDFFVRGTNLLNEEARLHTSFLKELAPLPGRNFTAGVRMNF